MTCLFKTLFEFSFFFPFSCCKSCMCCREIKAMVERDAERRKVFAFKDGTTQNRPFFRKIEKMTQIKRLKNNSTTIFSFFLPIKGKKDNKSAHFFFFFTTKRMLLVESIAEVEKMMNFSMSLLFLVYYYCYYYCYYYYSDSQELVTFQYHHSYDYYCYCCCCPIKKYEVDSNFVVIAVCCLYLLEMQ